jgi:hypothetical protein
LRLEAQHLVQQIQNHGELASTHIAGEPAAGEEGIAIQHARGIEQFDRRQRLTGKR